MGNGLTAMVLALAVAGVAGVVAQGGPPVTPAVASLTATLREVERAQVELVRGQPDAFKQLWSRRDDVTLVGGLGGEIERGWAGVSRRLDWVSTQYAEGRRQHEVVSQTETGDLGYVVLRETIDFVHPVEKRPVRQALRVTMVFRREDGAWRIVHRHADAQTVRQP